MGKVKLIILAMFFCLFGCSKASEEIPTEEHAFDAIVGRWTTTAYFTSGNYFVQNNDGEYYSGKLLNTYDYYDYGYATNTQIITCKHEKGWDLGIKVEFVSENEAIFYISGKTVISSKTIKVTRNQ
jgi:hypothetical protein